MTKALQMGSFVTHEAHPEHGLGRVVAMGAFATRVLFTRGGLRVFRAEDTQRLRTVASPPVAEVAALDEKERALAAGVVQPPVGAAPEPTPPKKRARKGATAVPS